MEKNTDTYNESILKDIELGINDTCVKLVHYSKIDKTPEDVIEEAILKERLGALKIIKTELIRENDNREYRLSKDGETKVMLKLKAKHEEAMEDYKKVGRNDLYDHEKAELDVINEFTPKQPTEEEILEFTNEKIGEFLVSKPSDYVISMRDMGQIMPKVKAKYPNANGNIVKTALTSFMK